MPNYHSRFRKQFVQHRKKSTSTARIERRIAKKDHSHVFINGQVRCKGHEKHSPSGVVYICNGVQSHWIVPGTWFEDTGISTTWHSQKSHAGH